jgi:hypothetical protein
MTVMDVWCRYVVREEEVMCVQNTGHKLQLEKKLVIEEWSVWYASWGEPMRYFD